MNVWDPHRLEMGQCTVCTIGTLRIWIELRQMEYRIAFEYLAEERGAGQWSAANNECEPVEKTVWNRCHSG
jgi:hypothetical protein